MEGLSVVGAGASNTKKRKNVNNMSDSLGDHKPWTNEEHRKFLEALEKYGNGTSGMEWQQIATYVGSRTYNEIKLHAHKYFIKLQQATQSRRSAGTADETPLDLDDGNWTYTEDLIFENGLARYDETTVGRWELIAKLLPGKTPEDTRKRYQKLLFDIARIENGEEVELLYSPGLIEGEVDGGEKKGKEGEVIVYNEV